MITDLPPEFSDAGLIACSTFSYKEDRYTLVTLNRAVAPSRLVSIMLSAWAAGGANIVPMDRQGRFQPYDSILLKNSEPVLWPFGQLPGNILQGVIQCYTTESEADAGHDALLERVKNTVLHGKG